MRRDSLGLWLVVFFGVAVSHAQTTTGTISGTVKDPSGAVLPGATVTILNEDTGISRTVQSDAAGRYTAPALSLGKYRVTASQEGFQTEARSGIELTLGRQAVVNFQLQVGAVTQTVEVTGEAPLVDTARGGVGQLVEGSTISELPLNGRDLAQLIILQTGAVDYSGYGEQGGRGSTGGKIISVSGSRLTTNVFLMDGVVIESSNQKTPTGVSGNFLGVDAIREFKVETNAYSAEFGRGAGGIFNLATKSGTNNLHGTAFEFHRNDNFDAARWEDNAFGNAKPEFKRNQFGFSLGGPLVKDRTFFFGTYEGFRERLGRTIVSRTFSDSLRQGIIGGQRVEIQPRVLPYVTNPTLWPTPNGRTYADGTADYTFTFSQPTDENFFQVRVDHQFSEKDSAFVRYTFSDSSQTLPGSFPQFPDHITARNQYLTIEESRIFSPSFLTSFRFGFTRTSPLEIFSNPDVDAALLFVPTIPQLGAIEITGLNAIGNGTTGGGLLNNSFQWAADARYIRGRNALKFGFSWNLVQFNGWLPGRDAGLYTFGSVAAFFNADPSRFRGTIAAAHNDAYRSVSEDFVAFYAQDDIQVAPRLTLNLGLRYEFIRIPRERHGRVGTFRGDAAFIQGATVNDIVTGNPWIENPSKKNFAPRLGFAWDVFGDGKTAVSGGFGIFHLQFNHTWFRTAVFRMPPFLAEIQATPQGSGAQRVAVPFPNIYQLCARENPFFPQDARCSGRPAPDFPDYEFNTPYMMQYNLQVQKQLTADTVVRVGYVGSRGVRLPGVSDLNQATGEVVNGRLFFAATRRPNPNFDDLRYRYPAVDSFYNSLQLHVSRRFRQGFQFGTSYTFSKSIDDISGNQTASDTDAGVNWITYYADKSLNRSLSAFDARHVFTLNSTYELPFGPGKPLGSGLTGVGKHLLAGWQLGGIVSLSTGFPGTISMASRLTGIGIRQEFPDLLPGANNNPSRPGNPDQYFDTSVFVAPPARTLGNLGRNTLILPGRATVDFSLTKNTDLRENTRLQFRFEGFNFFNRVNLGIPALEALDNQGRPVATAGRITRTATTARQIQLGLKLIF